MVEKSVELHRDFPKDKQINKFEEKLDVGKSNDDSSKSQLYISIIFLASPKVGGVENHPSDVIDPREEQEECDEPQMPLPHFLYVGEEEESEGSDSQIDKIWSVKASHEC